MPSKLLAGPKAQHGGHQTVHQKGKQAILTLYNVKKVTTPPALVMQWAIR